VSHRSPPGVSRAGRVRPNGAAERARKRDAKPGTKHFAVLSEPLAKLRAMKIVVTTPAGHVGSRVVQVLLQAGVRPALLARQPARLDPRVVERADVVQADQADADAVVRATRDAGALFWVAPDTAGPDADPVAWYAQLGANAARAVTENGIARTVFLSSVGAEMRSGAGAIDGLPAPRSYSTPPAPRCCTCAAASSSRTCSLIPTHCATASCE
jgi:hypothetical protein